MNKILLLLIVIAIYSSSCNKDNDSPEEGNSTCNGPICEPSLLADETAATVNESMHGSYSLIYAYAEANSPFENGTRAKFTLTSNNELVVEIEGEECYTLKNPALRFNNSAANYFFKDDCKKDICYNVSETQTGVFNEVNIQPYEGMGWYGQFAAE